MGLPTSNELTMRQKTAQKQLQRLRETSEAFFVVWEELEKEGQHLTRDLSVYVDKFKLKHIHDKIHTAH